MPDLSVSHRHATVRQRGIDHIVVDEGSSNGTFLGSVRLYPQTPRVLRSGDMIRIGRVWLEVSIDFSMPTPHAPQATRELALALVAEALDAQGERGGPRLVVVEGPDTGKELDLSIGSRPLVLGRGRDVDLPLDVTDASRRHAQVSRHGEQVRLRDLGSRNGTVVGDELVPEDRDFTLRIGDRFRIGEDVIVFEHPAAEALREIERADDEQLDKAAPAEPQPQPLAQTDAEASAAPAHQAQLSAGHTQPAAPAPQKPKPAAKAAPKAAPARTPRRGADASPGWGKTDFIIVLLAVAVLTLSGVGLFWLYRSG
ncbi:MAG: FHA domain-containing protein [Polyangiaceae bacterium]|nr:FHA domain-containing protein [Polyangiaceae bacterium]